jgi:tripartite-type tricarboxylate transporter receptor subunit TctC
MRRHVLAISIAAVLSSSVAALAADDYPNKPVKLILPAAAGGPTDVPARIASQILQPKLGQPMVIENRPGAGGALGARVVATAAPDGYTLLVANTSVLAVIPAVSASAGYDPVKNFVPIVRMTESFQLLVVNADSPWKTLKEFVDYCKANPGKLNYAHTGAGGLPHLVGELFMLRSGCKMTAVPYRSGGESVTAVLSKAVDTTIEGIAITRSLILDGKVRALGGQNRTRTPLLPDMPTMAEAGVPGVVSATDYAIYAPAGTPKEIVARLNRETNAVLQLADFRAKLAAQGIEISGSTPEAMQAELADEIAKWAQVIKAANVKPE